jgi:hypothetical protein
MCGVESGRWKRSNKTRHTAIYHVHGQKVGADGEGDHCEGEGEELEDDVSACEGVRSHKNVSRIMAGFGGTNEGTAGVMFDLGSDLTSSWSR